MPTPMTPEAQAAYDQARQRIAECRAKNDRELDLSGLGLTALPPEIGELSALESLRMGENQLEAMAPEIGRLAALTVLELQENKLSVLPPEIGQLRALTKLSLYENQLTALPPEIGQLVRLKKLFIHRNRLVALPAEIGQFAALNVLAASDNQLLALAPEIGQLTALESLELHGNQLTTFPVAITQLLLLKALSLSRNPIPALPPEIGRLTKLAELHGNEMALTTLPAELFQLTELVELELQGSQLTTIPPEIGNLTQLTELTLSRNRLTALPKEIGHLTALKVLGLAENQLTALPPEMKELRRLKKLWLHGNPGLGIPDAVLGPTLPETSYRAGASRQQPANPAAILAHYFGEEALASAPMEKEEVKKRSPHPGVNARMHLLDKEKLDHAELLRPIFAQVLERMRAETIEHDPTWRLGEADWGMDQSAGKISFRWGDGSVATGEMQIIGLLKPDGAWLWSWTISNVPRPLQEHARTLWKSGNKEDFAWISPSLHGLTRDENVWGFPALAERIITGDFPATEEEAWGFAALACILCQAQGVCRIGVGPGNASLLFVTFDKVQVNKPASAEARARAASMRLPPAILEETGEPRGGLIEGIETYYAQIAAGLRQEANEEFKTASGESIFYSSSSCYFSEFVSVADGRPSYMSRPSRNHDIIQQMRKQFRAEGKPLWGRCRFDLDANGELHAWWGYESCDENGNFVCSDEEMARMNYARQKRLARPAWERYLLTGPSGMSPEPSEF